MQTKTLVRPSAETVRIVTLSKGDVYKRLVDDPYAAAKKKIVVGVVTDVLHNGDAAALTAIEVTDSYGTVEVKAVAFSGEDDLALYPASTGEVKAVLDEALVKQRTQVETKEADAARARALLRTLDEIQDEALTAAATEQIQIEG